MQVLPHLSSSLYKNKNKNTKLKYLSMLTVTTIFFLFSVEVSPWAPASLPKLFLTWSLVISTYWIQQWVLRPHITYCVGSICWSYPLSWSSFFIWLPGHHKTSAYFPPSLQVISSQSFYCSPVTSSLYMLMAPK